MVSWLVVALVGLIGSLLMRKGVIALWYKMHALVGIEVGPSRYALLGSTVDKHNQLSDSLDPKLTHRRLVSNHSKPHYWWTRHGHIPSLGYLKGVHTDNINRLPLTAVQQLIAINERVACYLAWQQQSQSLSSATGTPWLTESQFVVNRLLDTTLPEAINHYDQLATFNPAALHQPMFDGLTPEQVLFAVLHQVDSQLTTLLDDLTQQTTQQLATTYRYIKTRAQ